MGLSGNEIHILYIASGYEVGWGYIIWMIHFPTAPVIFHYIGFRFFSNRAVIHVNRLSLPSSVLASKYARV